MKLETLDHLVLTTDELESCLAFYAGFLGMEHIEYMGKHSLRYGGQKINVHTRGGQFQPAAANPVPGCLDLCFSVQDPWEDVLEEAARHGIKPETDIVPRFGAKGRMQSIYFRDPDGNLVELCRYCAD